MLMVGFFSIWLFPIEDSDYYEALCPCVRDFGPPFSPLQS
jgi:hypothetical protein